MTGRMMWIPMALALVLTAAAQPWQAGAADARPARKPVPACRPDEVAKLRAELAATQEALAVAQADAARARGEVARLLEYEKQRAKKLADQLGSPMIETLKGGDLK